MNIHVRWRLDLARNLCGRLTDYPGTRAVVVAGSVARGYSDIYSDLELIMYWDRTPEPELRRSIVTDLQAEYRYPKIDHGHESALLIGDFPVDLWHRTVSDEEKVIHKVLGGEHSLDLDANNTMDTLRACIPMYGEDVVRQWKQRIEAYPEALSVRFLQAYLPHFHLRHLYFAAHRDNPSAYFSTLGAIQSSLFLVLLALNRSYFPTYKWMFKRLDELPLVPDRIGERLRNMFDSPPLQAVGQLHDVLAETLALAEKHFPQLDTAFARYGVEQSLPVAFEEGSVQY